MNNIWPNQFNLPQAWPYQVPVLQRGSKIPCLCNYPAPDQADDLIQTRHTQLKAVKEKVPENTSIISETEIWTSFKGKAKVSGLHSAINKSVIPSKLTVRIAFSQVSQHVMLTQQRIKTETSSDKMMFHKKDDCIQLLHRTTSYLSQTRGLLQCVCERFPDTRAPHPSPRPPVCCASPPALWTLGATARSSGCPTDGC